MAEQMVDAEAVAYRLGVSRTTIYRHANQGVLPGHKVGRIWRFWPSEVDASLNAPKDPWKLSKGSLAQLKRRTK